MCRSSSSMKMDAASKLSVDELSFLENYYQCDVVYTIHIDLNWLTHYAVLKSFNTEVSLSAYCYTLIYLFFDILLIFVFKSFFLYRISIQVPKFNWTLNSMTRLMYYFTRRYSNKMRAIIAAFKQLFFFRIAITSGKWRAKHQRQHKTDYEKKKKSNVKSNQIE